MPPGRLSVGLGFQMAQARSALWWALVLSFAFMAICAFFRGVFE